MDGLRTGQWELRASAGPLSQLWEAPPPLPAPIPHSSGFIRLPQHPVTLTFSLTIGLEDVASPLTKFMLGTTKEGILDSWNWCSPSQGR